MNKIARLCVLVLAWIFGIIPHSCIAAEDDQRPPEHLCPITQAVMIDPVVAADGQSYEREAISRWFVTSRKSPMSNADLEHTNLTVNLSLKKMISDWRPGRQMRPSDLDAKPAADIAQRIKAEFEKNKRLLHSAKGQHIVAFLGNTGSGKSTLVNLLAGKGLVVGPDGDDYILADPTDAAAMIIGTRGNSETLYPKFIDVNGLRFVDLPGFNDTEGSERNLVNAAFIRQILLEAESVRLVFVAGQDQFTADKSASVKQMFSSIKQLFVVDGQGDNLVNDGVFVATKVTCNEGANIPDFLVKKTDSRDKEELNTQLQSWNRASRLCHIFHPVRGNNNTQAGEQILSLIRGMRPAKIVGVNVSALYPPETRAPLERMFSHVMQGIFDHRLSMPLTTLSEYDTALTLYTSQDFWKTFDTSVCTDDKAISLLKEFCINPYNRSLGQLERENTRKRQTYIQSLRDKRQERVEDIGERTEGRAREVIASLAPRQNEGDFVLFDFGYHPQFHQQVCGAEFIDRLATDPQEQEVVRQSYAEFISGHSHEQMMSFLQRFSGIDNMARRLALLEERLRERENPNTDAVPRPVVSDIVIPDIARGYEEIYRRFFKGALIYKKGQPDEVRLPFSGLVNPLEGTFDLSRCGDSGQHLSISTGYRKGKKAENANKVEIWLAPRFLIESNLAAAARHYQPIMGDWNATAAPAGIFWDWGGWDDLGWFEHLTTNSFDDLGSEDLLQKNKKARSVGVRGSRLCGTGRWREFKGNDGRFMFHF